MTAASIVRYPSSLSTTCNDVEGLVIVLYECKDCVGRRMLVLFLVSVIILISPNFRQFLEDVSVL